MDSPKQSPLIRETEHLVRIDIERRDYVKSPSNANTVEIHIMREKEEYFEIGSDGIINETGSSCKVPFPTPVVLLNDVVSFEPDYISGLLYPTIEGDYLRFRLANQVTNTAYEAKRDGVRGPLYIFLRIEVIQIITYGGSEEEENETCAICLEDISYSPTARRPKYLSCSHVFHDDCLLEWETKYSIALSAVLLLMTTKMTTTKSHEEKQKKRR